MMICLALEDILSQTKFALDFPSKKSEKWHLSSIDSYLDTNYYLEKETEVEGFVKPKESQWIYLKDGKLHDKELPKGVSIKEAAKAYTYEDNPFAYVAQDTAFSPLEVHISKDAKVTIYLDYSEGVYISSSFNIIVAKGVKAQVKLRFKGAKSSFISHHSLFKLSSYATLELYQTQELEAKGVLVSQNAYELDEHAQCKSYMLLHSGEHLQNFISATLGFASDLVLSCLLMAHGKDRQIISSVINHNKDQAQSLIASKQLLYDQSTAVFDATTIIAKGTKESKVLQSSHALLLSDKAHIYAKPHLEIYSDDLTASHGSTVGELDEEALYYLCTRGLSPSKAKALLIQAFIAELLEALPQEERVYWESVLGDDYGS